jgi:agmatinase
MAETGREFDPGAVAVKNGALFGLPYTLDEAEVVVVSAPWDVTTSYRDGTALGPEAVIAASYQLDFTSPFRRQAWATRIGTVPLRQDWKENGISLRREAKVLLEALEDGAPLPDQEARTARLNRAGSEFHAALEAEVAQWLAKGKRVVTLGGDHSVSLGPIRAHARSFPRFSVLHLDAHADLRVAYEGFTHSHASIMHHVKDLPQVDALVQVGLRDLSPEEEAEARENPKIHPFFDWDLKRRTLSGQSWKEQCQDLLRPLGEFVYISADIDGLDPRYCPNTGTPVPGGLELHEFLFLLQEIQDSGRKIIGADLVEVAPARDGNEWDANVGARLLFQFCQFVRNSLPSPA